MRTESVSAPVNDQFDSLLEYGDKYLGTTVDHVTLDLNIPNLHNHEGVIKHTVLQSL